MNGPSALNIPRDLTKPLLVICVVISIADLLLKLTMRLGNYSLKFGDYLQVKLVYNHSSFLGFLSETSPFVKRVSLSILGAYFLTVMIVFILSLWRRSFPWSKSALIMITFGASGNIIERTFTGKVTDYFSLPFFNLNVYMNLVDLILFFGLLLFLASLLIEGKRLFYENCQRSLKLLAIPFQRSIACYSFLCSFLLSISVYAIFITVLSKSYYAESFQTINLLFVIVVFLNSSLLTIILLKVTHRSSGATYAIFRDLQKLKSGEITEIKLREGDFHKDLADKISQILNVTKKQAKSYSDPVVTKRTKKSI